VPFFWFSEDVFCCFPEGGGLYLIACVELDIFEWSVVVENRRKSKIKKIRKSGFRARARSKKGRRIMSKQRARGRSVNCV
jgi:ribosomal protein L34